MTLIEPLIMVSTFAGFMAAVGYACDLPLWGIILTALLGAGLWIVCIIRAVEGGKASTRRAYRICIAVLLLACFFLPFLHKKAVLTGVGAFSIAMKTLGTLLIGTAIGFGGMLAFLFGLGGVLLLVYKLLDAIRRRGKTPAKEE